MKITHELMFRIEPTRRDGKARWVKCGALMESDKGLRVKLDAIPVGFNGWLAAFEPRSRQEPRRDEFDDDLPL